MTLNIQFMTMAAMIFSGISFGMMLDTYQLFLNRPKRKSWITFINDILFWVVQALLVFYILFLVNHGEIRFYIFLALLCGFAAYQALLKGIYLWVLDKFILAVKFLWRIIVNTASLLIFKPITGLIQLIIGVLVLLGKALISTVRVIFNILFKLIKLLLWAPLKKIMEVTWKLLPKGIKKSVEKLYNKLAGFFLKAQKLFNKAITWGKSKKLK